MLRQHAFGSETWRKFVKTMKAANIAAYVPEYTDDHERGLNYRYYR